MPALRGPPQRDAAVHPLCHPWLEDKLGSLAAGQLGMVLPYRVHERRERMLGYEEKSAQTASNTLLTAWWEQGRCQARGCRCLVSVLRFWTPPVHPGDGTCCSVANNT